MASTVEIPFTGIVPLTSTNATVDSMVAFATKQLRINLRKGKPYVDVEYTSTSAKQAPQLLEWIQQAATIVTRSFGHRIAWRIARNDVSPEDGCFISVRYEQPELMVALGVVAPVPCSCQTPPVA